MGRSAVIATLVGGCVCLGGAAAAQDSTATLITAPRISNLLTVSRSSDQAREQTKADFQFSLRPAEWESLQPGMTFSGIRDVRIGYQNFNPLQLAVSASETVTPDPNHQQLTEFVEALLKVPGIITAGQSGSLRDCPAVREMADDLDALQNRLNASKDVAAKFQRWTGDIGKAPGPVSIKGVANDMRDTASTINRLVTGGRALLALMKERAKSGLAAGGTSSGRSSSGTTATSSGGQEVAATDPTKSRTPDPGKAEEQQKADAQRADLCADADVIRALLSATVQSNPAYEDRLDKVTALATALNALAASLDKVAVDGDWEGSTYIFFRSRASAEQLRTISIKATPINYQVEGLTLNRQQQDSKVASANFLLRQYQGAIPEMGAGFVLSTVRAPQFGTGTKDGQTIVVRKKDKPVSLAGALLLNWVFARSATSAIRPIFQTGVSISPDGPGVLLGTGFRLTRPKRVAVGFGGMLAWVKDLTDLHAGGPVTGTAELESDLKYKPTVKAYFTIQYQFK